MSCEHALNTNYGIRLTIPSDFYVIETSTCAMGGQNALYSCSTSNSDGTITVMNFLSSALEEDESFTFTIDSIRNPTTFGNSYSVQVESLSETDGAVDVGTFTIVDTLIVKGSINSFTIVPQDYGVGQYPTFYDFTVQPSGEMYEDSYLVLTLPD